jgi:hypothetical protein
MQTMINAHVFPFVAPKRKYIGDLGLDFLIYFISNQNLQSYELICWRKSCDAPGLDERIILQEFQGKTNQLHSFHYNLSIWYDM